MTNKIRRWVADRMIAVLCSVGFAIVGVSLAVPLLSSRRLRSSA